MNRSASIVRSLVATALAVATAAGVPAPLPVAGSSPPSSAWTVPAELPNAPITLDDGTVLPMPPAGYLSRPSVPATLDAEHADDPLAFTPGGRPTVDLAVPGASIATDGAPSVLPLGLAKPTTSAAADLTALPNGLKREVFGFLPYWMLDAGTLQWMQYQLVSTIAYFGVGGQAGRDAGHLRHRLEPRGTARP